MFPHPLVSLYVFLLASIASSPSLSIRHISNSVGSHTPPTDLACGVCSVHISHMYAITVISVVLGAFRNFSINTSSVHTSTRLTFWSTRYLILNRLLNNNKNLFCNTNFTPCWLTILLATMCNEILNRWNINRFIYQLIGEVNRAVYSVPMQLRVVTNYLYDDMQTAYLFYLYRYQ